ncbi:MAG TPA: K(+)-transporting ATPase subunit F [Candidatus Dormibacteraeota bacterium]|nr:K(+)-transporting ATPase subunit F [Candidatus Dormibacteraeota bacterium]
MRPTLMFDQILGLVLTVAGIVYLTYAMLRPERF